MLSSNFCNLAYEYIMQGLEFKNIFYIIAVIAILYILNNISEKIITLTQSKKSSFFVYKLVFSLIFFESFSMILFLENFKQQISVLIWIIYVSALLILFLIFLTLTVSDSFYSKHEESSGELTHSIKNTENFDYIIKFVTFMMFILCYSIIKEVLSVMYLQEILGSSITKSYNYFVEIVENSNNVTKTLENRELIDINNIFNVIKRDFTNNLINYILSAVLQATALFVVVCTII